MLAGILRAAGLRVGLYTSPHLVRINERIRLLDPRIAQHLGQHSEPESSARSTNISGEISDAEFAARVATERGNPVETTIPLQVIKAKLDGIHPLKAWREYRGITQIELASRSAVARDLVAQIETHKKQGSVATLDRLARALRIPIEALIAERGLV